VIKTKISYRG